MDTSNIFFSGIATSRVTAKVPQACLNTAMPEVPGAHDELFARLFSRHGLNASAYRHSALARRLPSLLRTLGTQDLEKAAKILDKTSSAATDALNAVLLGVTDFFRDQSVFDALRDTVLPSIMTYTPRPRIWSAACSNGPELYSVAMLLHEAGWLEQCHLLGTDCRVDALEEAAAGIYSLREGSRVPNHGEVWNDGQFIRMSPALRSSVKWRASNLLESAEGGPWDLVLWRNMGIYLTPAAAERVWERIVDELSPQGYIVVGKAEQPPRGLGLVRTGTATYRKANS